jgi:hypothetical protein
MVGSPVFGESSNPTPLRGFISSGRCILVVSHNSDALLIEWNHQVKHLWNLNKWAGNTTRLLTKA